MSLLFLKFRTIIELVTGKGLAAHLQVPLPYLLYRVNARFQEELRGLQGINDILSPTVSQQASPSQYGESPTNEMTPSVAMRALGSTRQMSTSSGRISTPLGIRARLNSLGQSQRPRKTVSSSTLTVQGPRRPPSPIRPVSPPSESDSDSDDEEDSLKEEEAERQAEEQETLDKKLRDLQQMMTNDTLGLVSSTSRRRGRAKRTGANTNGVSSSDGGSASLSSASSSIPDIPSPRGESQPTSPQRLTMSSVAASKSRSPPAVSSRNAVGQRYGQHLIQRTGSERSSAQASQASSFSDLSGGSSLYVSVAI